MITDHPQPITRRLAITLVTAGLRSDGGTVKALLRAADPDEFAVLVACTLELARALAGQLLTPRGLLAADLWLAECARGHPCAETRLGAELVLAHEAVAAAEESGDMIDVAVGAYNAVCCQADEEFDEEFEEVLTAGLLCWRSLLTPAATAALPVMVGNVAGQLWGGAPKLEGEGTTMKFKSRDETGPPQPTLAIPPEAEVVHRPYRPYQAYLPAGTRISYRGLALRLRQERGLE